MDNNIALQAARDLINGVLQTIPEGATPYDNGRIYYVRVLEDIDLLMGKEIKLTSVLPEPEGYEDEMPLPEGTVIPDPITEDEDDEVMEDGPISRDPDYSRDHVQ